MNYSRYIDHTLLKANARKEDIILLCSDAIKYDFYSVCVNPCYVTTCKDCLKYSNVKVCTVIGFPLGANSNEVKVYEAQQAIKDGADEIDVVMNIGKFKEKDYLYVLNELTQIVRACKKYALIKVIIETSLLTNEEITKACEVVIESGADFVKTSTGFSTRGASKEDVLLMKSSCEGKISIKASGGISTLEQMKSLINLGANRIGTSRGVEIMQELSKK